MRPRRSLTLLAAAAASLLPSPGLADAVLDWNEVALARVVEAGQLPPEGARSMAMVHVAVFDALDAIDRRYEPFAFRATGPPTASPDAATAAAAFTVLAELFPAQLPALQAAYSTALAEVPEGEARAAGIALGEAAAAACLAARSGDGASPELG